MNRRNFLRSLVGGVATAAAVRSWPFRVYSFPSTRIDVIDWRYWGGIRLVQHKPLGLAEIQALELETVREEIPKLIYQPNIASTFGINYLRIPHPNGEVEWINLDRRALPSAV